MAQSHESNVRNAAVMVRERLVALEKGAVKPSPATVEALLTGMDDVAAELDRLDADGKDVRTDENNFVVDLHLERIDHPQELAEDLINTVGVVEHGLFLHMVDQVIVGDPNGPRVLTNSNK